MLYPKSTSLLLAAVAATSLLSLPIEAKEKTSKAAETPAATGKPTPAAHPADVEPTIGMTEAEVLKQYGKPWTKASVLGGNETWKYRFDKGKDFIPGGFFMKKRQGSVTFDKKTGKVIAVKWGKSRF